MHAVSPDEALHKADNLNQYFARVGASIADQICDAVGSINHG